jgi:hypothetical protein
MQLSNQVAGLVKSLSAALDTNAKGNRTNKRKAQSQPKQQRPAKRQRTGADLRQAPVSLGYVQPPVGMRSLAPVRPGGEVRFTGCDYIGSVSAGTTAADNIYSLNPLVAATYPRLQAIATIFGKYAYNRLRFYVIGKAASTQPGDMTSVTVYEEGGSNALTEAQVKNRYGQTTSKFWENHQHMVDPKKATVPWFPMDAFDASSSIGVFGWYHFFTEAVAAAIPVADIFVEYDIEFCEARAVGDTD